MALLKYMMFAIILLALQMSQYIVGQDIPGFQMQNTYTNAIEALKYIDRVKPASVRIAASNIGNSGFQILVNGGYLRLLTGHAEIVKCLRVSNPPPHTCVFKAFEYFKQAIQIKGYLMIGQSTLLVYSFNGQPSYSGNADFVLPFRTT